MNARQGSVDADTLKGLLLLVFFWGSLFSILVLYRNTLIKVCKISKNTNISSVSSIPAVPPSESLPNETRLVGVFSVGLVVWSSAFWRFVFDIFLVIGVFVIIYFPFLSAGYLANQCILAWLIPAFVFHLYYIWIKPSWLQSVILSPEGIRVERIFRKVWEMDWSRVRLVVLSNPAQSYLIIGERYVDHCEFILPVSEDDITEISHLAS